MRSEQLVGIGLVVDAEPLDHRGAGSVEPNNFDRGAFAPEADHRLIQHAHARDVPEVRITQVDDDVVEHLLEIERIGEPTGRGDEYLAGDARSEERGGGKACVIRWRYRGWA